MRIENVDLGIRNWLPDGNAPRRGVLPVVFLQPQGERAHRGFRRPIVIHNLAVRVEGFDLLDQLRSQRLPTCDQIFPRQHLLAFRRIHQRRQVRRHNLQHVNRMFLVVSRQALRIGRSLIADHMQASTRDQRRIYAGVAQVGCNGRHCGELQSFGIFLQLQPPADELGVID